MFWKGYSSAFARRILTNSSRLLQARSVSQSSCSSTFFHCHSRYPFNSPKHLATFTRKLAVTPPNSNIVRSPYPDVSLVPNDVSLPVYLFGECLKNNPHQTAMVDSVTGRSVTFAQLQEDVSKFGSALARRGVRPGSVVLIYMSNSIEYAVAFLGTLTAGCVVSTANTLYTVRELEYQIKDVNATMLVTSASFLSVAMTAAQQGGVREVIVANAEGGYRGIEGVQVVPFSQILSDSGSALPSFKVNNRQDVAVIPYSSGTTGAPKGVQLTHFTLITNLQQVSAHSDIICLTRREDENILCLMPFFHIYGMVVLLLNGLLQKTKLITIPNFEPEKFLAAIEQYRVSQLFLAPPVVLFLCKHPSVPNYDLSSVYNICSAAAPLGSSVAKEAVERLRGCSIMQGYGLTELSPVSHWSPFSAPRDGSVGVAVPSTEVAVVHDGQKVGPGISGEICVRGPQVMLGYLNRPQATAEMIDTDGWLHTGDIGHYDDAGHFYITDRLKELIKRKGYQVAPAELEHELLLHPDIVDAAVMGVPDEREGELPAAFIVQRPDSNLTAERVMEFMSDRVAPFKRLDGGVLFVDSIPKTPSGKIMRRLLKDKL